MNKEIQELIDRLSEDNYLEEKDLIQILDSMDKEDMIYLRSKANETKEKYYGKDIYIRGLIEISNFCTRGCKYCGINTYNKKVERYRLSRNDILSACNNGDRLGINTFVLQGGEDKYLTDDRLINIVSSIKKEYPEKAITLSLGERSYESYKKLYNAGADRYLLRHETANKKLYKEIHRNIEFNSRKKALYNLKNLGYQVGAGFMVGIPGQKVEDLAKDILFLKELNPEMIGLGPFIPHEDTVYRNEKSGDLDDVLNMIALTRLYLPTSLLPATTALSTIHKEGRRLGLKSGGNVIMPNLSPMNVRDKYNLYKDKAYLGKESAEALELIEKELLEEGLIMNMSRGDNILWR